MRFFTFITLFTTFLLILSDPFNPNITRPKRPSLELARKYQQNFKQNFHSAQNANVLWAFITGDKKGISPRVQKDFNDLELGFLFSPSGIHLAGLMALIFFLIKKIKQKKITKLVEWVFLGSIYFLPYLAIKRLIIFRLLILLNKRLNLKADTEVIFLITFFISFFLGHYSQSPIGFILSFLYMGTFISLRNYSRPIIFLGLFSSHLLVCFFSGNEVSPLGLVFNLPILGLFSLLFPAFILYFLSFRWIHFNWIELFIRFFILSVHWMAKIPHGTLISSTFFLILAVWIILLKWPKKYLLLLLLLHGNVANSPSFYYQKSCPQEQRPSAHK